MMPLLHAGGFSWDELIVLVVAIAAVPALTWFMGRLNRDKPDTPAHDEQSPPVSPDA